MIEKSIERVVDGIKREIIVEADDGKSRAKFYEDGELQMIIDIPEDVTKMPKSRVRSRKYSVIFNYYLDNGIQDLTYKNIKSMINTYYIICEIEFVFSNKNGTAVKAKEYTHSRQRHFTASCQETHNGVLFEFTSYFDDCVKYRVLNESCKQSDSMSWNSYFYWEGNISYEPYRGKCEEECVIVRVNGIPYTMSKKMYDRINDYSYLRDRNIFKKNSCLFYINNKQKRLLTKNTVLKKQQNFIKHINLDGTIVVE